MLDTGTGRDGNFPQSVPAVFTLFHCGQEDGCLPGLLFFVLCRRTGRRQVLCETLGIRGGPVAGIGLPELQPPVRPFTGIQQ